MVTHIIDLTYIFVLPKWSFYYNYLIEDGIIKNLKSIFDGYIVFYVDELPFNILC